MTGSSKTFPELVREVRKQLGISQEGLAHELGVSFATIGARQESCHLSHSLGRLF